MNVHVIKDERRSSPCDSSSGETTPRETRPGENQLPEPALVFERLRYNGRVLTDPDSFRDEIVTDYVERLPQDLTRFELEAGPRKAEELYKGLEESLRVIQVVSDATSRLSPAKSLIRLAFDAELRGFSPGRGQVVFMGVDPIIHAAGMDERIRLFVEHDLTLGALYTVAEVPHRNPAGKFAIYTGDNQVLEIDMSYFGRER